MKHPFGSGRLGIGANFGWSFSFKHLDFGMSFGLTAWSDHVFTNESFLESRVGYGIGVGSDNFKVGFGHTIFWGGGIDQSTGHLRAYGKGRSVMYENDWVFPGAGMADNGDRWRTTGVGVSVGDFSAYMNLATGNLGLEERESRMVDGRETYTSGTSDKYRLGMIQVGYKGFHGGVNSENIRDIFQNKWAHGNGNRYPVFRKLNNSWFYAGGYRTKNSYTTW